jgi:hypothetical protein
LADKKFAISYLNRRLITIFEAVGNNLEIFNLELSHNNVTCQDLISIIKAVNGCPKIKDFKLDCSHNIVKEGFNVFLNSLKNLPSTLKFFELDLR